VFVMVKRPILELKMNALVGEYEASKWRVAVSKKCGADK